MSALELITERYADVERYRSGYGLHKIGQSDRLAYRTEKARIEAGTIDKSAMSVGCIVSTQDEDHSCDVIVTDGIDLELHQVNPVVNYNHGMGFNLPIGKAQDPNGAYTVTRGDGALRAVTYFSQNLLEAEQIFQLIEEGILNGVSIGCIPGRVEKRAVVNWKGLPGLMLYSCKMLEYSHTSNPDNPQALTDRVLSGRLAGKQISQVLYKSLAPYLIPQPAQISVPELAAELVKQLKGAKVAITKEGDKPGTGDYAPVDDGTKEKATHQPKDEPKDEPKEKPAEDEDDPTKDYPPGAKATAGLFDRMMETADFISSSIKGQENPAVKELLAEMGEEVAERSESLKQFFKENYEDLPELSQPEKEDQEAVAKSGTPRLAKILLPYRKSIIASVKGAAGQQDKIEIENKLREATEENAKLRKALEKSLENYDRLKREFNKAKMGR